MMHTITIGIVRPHLGRRYYNYKRHELLGNRIRQTVDPNSIGKSSPDAYTWDWVNEQLKKADRPKRAVKAKKGPDPLLTLRRDVLKAREALLGEDYEEALTRIDWALDCLEEHMAEG